MRTEKQIAASRLNGQKTRGPVTPMGKDRIRSNALKHGLTARMTLWQNEDPHKFRGMMAALLDEFLPANDVEFLCVEEMTMAKWRLRRVITLETEAGNQQLNLLSSAGRASTLAAFQAAQQAGQLLTTLRQHEAAYSRAYERAHRHLLKLRETRLADREKMDDVAGDLG